MTVAVPISGECAAHPGFVAAWACQRCGSFVCSDCERRTRPEAAPLCPKCWALREQVVEETAQTESKRLQVGGLIIGLLSFIHPLVMVGSLVLNIRELVRGTGGTRRWMNVAGLASTGVAIFAWVVLIVVVATRH